VSPTSEVDDLGHDVAVPRHVARVVSLVPSLTESVAETAPGLVVGATDWCTHPPGLDVARVGGTKNPRVDDIVALCPDVVVANDEENRAVDLDALRSEGVAVWVTAPTSVPAAIESLDRMLRIACRLARPRWLDEAYGVWHAPHDGPRLRAVVPIWRRPWMALGRDTFAGDVLARLGVDNVLSDSPERYPRIELDALPSYDVVVLPDEPYAFSPDDGPEAFTGAEVRCVSGRHLTWYGPSLVEARDVLSRQLYS
jgi:ABC-type Fe3+-hydroxamate transport system substrate-binding protein